MHSLNDNHTLPQAPDDRREEGGHPVVAASCQQYVTLLRSGAARLSRLRATTAVSSPAK